MPHGDFFICNDPYEAAELPRHAASGSSCYTSCRRSHAPIAHRHPLAGATAVNFRLQQAGTRYACPQTVFKLHPGFDALLRGIAIDFEAEAVGAGLAFPSVPCRRRSRTGAST
jgi:hypothetical protein